MLEIETPRLRLIPLTHHYWKIYLENGRSALDKSLGLAPCLMKNDPSIQAEFDEQIPNWLEKTKNYEDRFAWHTNFEIVLKNKNAVIGGMGLGGHPNPDGETMVGYMIGEGFKNMGFASEALKGLLSWAFKNPKLKAILAMTPIENIPSQSVLEKNDFKNIAQKEEEGMQVFVWKFEK